MGKVLGKLATYTLEEIIEVIEKLPSKDKIELLERIGSNRDELGISLASEQSLAKDWLSTEEDQAWKNL
ncbi:hypothetical protein [uncultured Arcticibacterium sp.]|uniref:hypothetical protein n=1 Tax=uncultured Arcticibacterium sp. TaxID=2173042 RepID=UPI0030F787AB